jgi:2-dehydro-3-deoxyphosphogluconate aldolase/(4S)-4-hydroxy-2-oxoglutarate aldolase
MTPQELEQAVRQAAVLPILRPTSVGFVVETAGILAEAGASAIEIVMRSPAALPALEACRKAYPELMLAAGTVLAPEHYDAAVNAGAHFAISPGYSPIIGAHAQRGPIPLVPGVQTATEVMAALAAGFRLLKFYPSEPAGGTVVLADYEAVFPGVAFMPSGKIGLDLLSAYARQGNVASVGGSWMYAQGDEILSEADIRKRMSASLNLMGARRMGNG